MTRALIVIRNELDRRRAAKWCEKAPDGCRVEFKTSKRSHDQNSRFWAMLTDIAAQKEHHGQKHPTETWKLLFMDAWQREAPPYIPALDGRSVVPLTRSSDLSKEEMSELIEFMLAWGAENGVTFHDTPAEPTALQYLASP